MSETVKIPADDIAIDTVQSRREPWQGDELDKALMDSISGIGLIHDIVVRKTTTGKYGGETDKPYALVAGSRRYYALIQTGVYEIPCKIMDLSDVEAAALSLSENLGRKDLTQHQKMIAIITWLTLLKNTGKTHTEAIKEIAKKCYGGDDGHIYAILQAASLPMELKMLLKKPEERTEAEKQILIDHDISPKFKLGYGDLAQVKRITEFLGDYTTSEQVDKIYSMFGELKIGAFSTQEYIRRTLKEVKDKLEEGFSFDIVMNDIKADRDMFTISTEKSISIIIPGDYESFHRRACSQAGKKGPELVREVYLNWLNTQVQKWRAP